MLIKNSDEKMWLYCKRCNTGFRLGGHCKCDDGEGIVTEEQKDGSTMIIASDSDDLVYDNEK